VIDARAQAIPDEQAETAGQELLVGNLGLRAVRLHRLVHLRGERVGRLGQQPPRRQRGQRPDRLGPLHASAEASPAPAPDLLLVGGQPAKRSMGIAAPCHHPLSPIQAAALGPRDQSYAESLHPEGWPCWPVLATTSQNGMPSRQKGSRVALPCRIPRGMAVLRNAV